MKRERTGGPATRAQLPCATPLASIIEVLRRSAFRVGTGDFEERLAAARWLATGFGPEDVARWLGARCFTPPAALSLRDAGLGPDQAARRARAGGADDTVGFMLASRNISLEQALDAVGPVAVNL